uniref:Enolase n=2 Tax=Anthurium amnicola TaxID=1678845 RepID=A0A1D1YCH0_9ARAE
MLKVPRSSRSCISFPRSKRTDGNVVHRTDELQNSAKETSEISHPPSEKAKRNSRILSIERSSFPIEAIKCTEVVKSVISKRMRRCRHAEKTGKEEKEFPTELSEGCHRSQALNNIGSACNNETNGTRKSNDSSKFWRTENRDNIGQASPSPSNGMDCGEDEVDSHPLDVEECIALKQMQICHTEVAQVGLPVETYNFKSMGKYSPEKAVASHSSGEVTTEDHGAVSCDRLEICPLEDPRESSVEKEATIASSFPRLLGDQGMHCGVIAGDEIISKDIQMVGQLELSVNDDSGLMPQNLQCKTDAVFVQGSSSCLIGPRDTSFELHDDSSVTSGRVATSQDNNIVGNGGPSGSPASSMSTVSHSSMEDLKFKNLELEASEEPVEIQEKMRPNCSNDLPLLHNGSRRGAKRTNPQERIQEVKPNAAAEQTEKRWDGQFHCCSQRGSISQESQLLSQSVTKANHVVSSVYVRPVFSSFHTRSTCISEALPVPILESPTDSISAKASSDSAQKFPTCSNFRLASSSCSTPSQSASSPILRLMGKDLMLTNSGVHHRNLAVHCSSINTSNARWHSSNNQTCVPPTFEPTGCFLGSTLQNGMVAKTNSPFHQKRSNEQWNSSAVCNLEKACLPQQQHNLIYLTQAPIQERERIVIDDSSELDGEVSGSLLSPASILAPTFSGSELGPARTFSYFSSQNPFQSSEMGCGLKSGLPVSCARANSDSTKLGSTSEASGPLLSSPFVAPSSSAGHLAPTICHPTRFR